MPVYKREQILSLWITHPLKSLRNFIIEIVSEYHNNIRMPTLVAIEIMLGNYDIVEEIDPDFAHIDSYLQNLDPLLGSLLVDRVIKLKSRKFQKTRGLMEQNSQYSLVDLLGRKDYDALWEGIFSYPFPYVAELFKIFHEEHWRPTKGYKLFELLLEFIGTKGWPGVEKIKYLAVSIRDQKSNKYRPLTTAELRARSFEIEVSNEVYTRPDRIYTQQFVDRGRFNLTDNEVGLYIYAESIRHTNFTGNLHVPIFSNNGVLLAEFRIVASSANAFAMDEDGLFFTIRVQDKLYSVDIDKLATLLLPINQFTEIVTETFQIFKENASPNLRLVVNAMELLSDLHLGRSFSLFDIKEQIELPPPPTSTCCAIGIDFGNATTKIVRLPSKCTHEIVEKSYPSIIHYTSGHSFIFGQQVVNANQERSAQTFFDIKKHILLSSTKALRVQDRTIDASQAGRDYLTSIIRDFLEDLNEQPANIAFTYPDYSPISYRIWFYELLESFGFKYITGIEDTTAVLTYCNRIYKTSAPTMIIDVGDAHTTVAIAQLPKNKIRKRLQRHLLAENQDAITMQTRKYINKGSQVINTLLEFLIVKEWGDVLNKEMMYKITTSVKYELTEKFESTLKSSVPKHNDIFFELSNDNFAGALEQTEYLNLLKVAIRDAFASSSSRGITKKKIKNVLLSGAGAKWPNYGYILYNLFNKKNVVLYEDDPTINAKGAALIGNYQSVAMKFDFDVMLKINEDAIVDFTTLIKRGEKIMGKAKIFKISKNIPFKSIVFDVWIRRMKLGEHNKIPPRDDERVHFASDDLNYFAYDHLSLFPFLISIKGFKDPHLIVGINYNGWLEINAFDAATTSATEVKLRKIAPLV